MGFCSAVHMQRARFYILIGKRIVASSTNLHGLSWEKILRNLVALTSKPSRVSFFWVFRRALQCMRIPAKRELFCGLNRLPATKCTNGDEYQEWLMIVYVQQWQHDVSGRDTFLSGCRVDPPKTCMVTSKSTLCRFTCALEVFSALGQVESWTWCPPSFFGQIQACGPQRS